jgi:DNA-directed RNA polymerase subunit M/transcription elongation factor TFIIS
MMKSSSTPPLHNAIPRVLCPDCGSGMRLTKIEPTEHAHEENTTFECRCGFSYTCSAPPAL